MTRTTSAPGLFDAPGVFPDRAAAHRYRRMLGGAYGLLLGVVYALTSGMINWLVLRDVPYRLDWQAVLISTLVTAALGLALGVVTACPESFVQGVILGAVAMSVSGSLYSLVTREFSFQLTVALLVTLLSRAALSALIVLPLRVLVHWHEESGLGLDGGGRLRVWLPVAAVMVGVFFGSLSQMPPEAKVAVRQTQRIMQNALAATTESEMPPALRRVPDFKAHAAPGYVLEATREQFAFEGLFRVSVYFDNGYVLSCLYAPSGAPACEEGGG